MKETMRKTHIRLCSVLLALVMLISAAALAACNGRQDGSDGTSSGEATSEPVPAEKALTIFADGKMNFRIIRPVYGATAEKALPQRRMTRLTAALPCTSRSAWGATTPARAISSPRCCLADCFAARPLPMPQPRLHPLPHAVPPQRSRAAAESPRATAWRLSLCSAAFRAVSRQAKIFEIK